MNNLSPLEKIEASSTASKLGIWNDAAIVLTMLASFSYDLGTLGIILPPEIKGYVAGGGLVATVILFLMKRFYELRAKGNV